MYELDAAEIERRIGLTAWQTGFPKDAVRFVLSTIFVPGVISQAEIDCKSFCCRLHDRALREFGPKARDQLCDWKINSTADFRKIVYGLILNGIMRESGGDSQSEFDHVFDFEAAFDQPMLMDSDRRQWTLSSMFVTTTAIAVAVFGFTRGGLDGINSAMFSLWLVLLGGYFVKISLLKQSKGWFLLFACGIVTLTAALLYLNMMAEF